MSNERREGERRLKNKKLEEKEEIQGTLGICACYIDNRCWLRSQPIWVAPASKLKRKGGGMFGLYRFYRFQLDVYMGHSRLVESFHFEDGCKRQSNQHQTGKFQLL